MSTADPAFDQVSEQIIGCAFTVANALGSGFLEKVYENALTYELRNSGLTVQQQYAAPVRYKGAVVGVYIADLLVENSVIIEIRAIRELENIHRAQCLNYLKATGLHLCLLINFGKPRAEIKRFVL